MKPFAPILIAYTKNCMTHLEVCSFSSLTFEIAPISLISLMVWTASTRYKLIFFISHCYK